MLGKSKKFTKSFDIYHMKVDNIGRSTDIFVNIVEGFFFVILSYLEQ